MKKRVHRNHNLRVTAKNVYEAPGETSSISQINESHRSKVGCFHVPLNYT